MSFLLDKGHPSQQTPGEAMASNNIVLLGCGDVGPIHEPIEAYSTLVRPMLAAADIRFAQAERVYSERGAFQVGGLSHGRLPPRMASVFSDCGFDVVSVAGNHAMDWGEEGLLDMIAVLRDRGIQPVGAGRNLEEARRPAILERKGVRVAVLTGRASRRFASIPITKCWRISPAFRQESLPCLTNRILPRC